MTEQEVSEYVNSLVQGKAKVSGFESMALDEWRELTADIAKASESLNRARSEVERLSALIQQMHGGRQAIVRLLVAGEEGRRNAANPNLELIEGKGAVK
jgi:multidrug resistance efflux pump